MFNVQSPRSDDVGIEQQIQAKGKTAPRVTPADLEAVIASEHYFTAAQGVAGRNLCAEDTDGVTGLTTNSPLHLLTFCVLVLKNGFTVTGESACASPENFDAAIGRNIARENAKQKLWPLLGYELKTKLANPAGPKSYEARDVVSLSDSIDPMTGNLRFRAHMSDGRVFSGSIPDDALGASFREASGAILKEINRQALRGAI